MQVAARVNKPPTWLLSKVKKLNSDHRFGKSMMTEYIAQAQQQMRQQMVGQNYQFPGRQYDRLFRSDSLHVGDGSCTGCDETAVVSRLDRVEPCVHFGLIGSGSQIMRSAEMRDNLRNGRNILCFETEAAGLMDNFPCLVIRGISDYADSHKNDFWQGYAAITSAAYAKDLLRIMNGGNVQNVEPVVAVIERCKMLVSA